MGAVYTIRELHAPFGSCMHHVGATCTVWEPHALYESCMGGVNQLCHMCHMVATRAVWDPCGAMWRPCESSCVLSYGRRLALYGSRMQQMGTMGIRWKLYGPVWEPYAVLELYCPTWEPCATVRELYAPHDAIWNQVGAIHWVL
jgi:hypothetical protein